MGESNGKTETRELESDLPKIEAGSGDDVSGLDTVTCAAILGI